jgi:PAS domain S-box-containing protein
MKKIKLNIKYKLLFVLLFFPLFMFVGGVITHDVHKQREKSLEIVNLIQKLAFKVALLNKEEEQFINYDYKKSRFYDTKTSASLSKHQALFQEIEQGILVINTQNLIKNDQINGQLNDIRSELKVYRKNFQILIDSIHKRGFIDYQNDFKPHGLEGLMWKYANDLEKTSLKYAPEYDLSVLLNMRRHEKNYQLRKDTVYRDRVLRLHTQLLTEITHLPLTNTQKAELIFLLKEYVRYFLLWVAIDQAIGADTNKGLIGQLMSNNQRIQNSIDIVVQESLQHYAVLHKRYQYYQIALISTLLLSSITASFLFASKLTKPLRAFSYHLNEWVNNGFKSDKPVFHYDFDDEIGDLIRNFEHMKLRLQHSFEAIEEQNIKIRESEQNLRLTFQQAPIGIVQTDFEGNILRYNAKWGEILGYTQTDELINRNIGEWMQPNDIAIDHQFLNDLLRGTIPFYKVVRKYHHANGGVVWGNLTVSIKYDINGQPQRLICIIEDITKQKNAESALKNTQKQLEESRRVISLLQEIEAQNKRIAESIQYAKHIQEAILPSPDEWKKYLPDSFILFSPKDTVSGDFYWMGETSAGLWVAAIDCTGHGVPGALMAMVGNTLLNKIIIENEVEQPAKVLEQLDKEIIKTLQKQDIKHKYGMDIALCKLNHDSVTFSGAYRPLWLVRNQELIEVKGNRFPIGFYTDRQDKNFVQHQLALEPNDMLYLFSDGYADQYGEAAKRKYLSSRFKTLLQEVSVYSAEQQKLILLHELQEWKGRKSQTDDILVVGMKANIQGKRNH